MSSRLQPILYELARTRQMAWYYTCTTVALADTVFEQNRSTAVWKRTQFLNSKDICFGQDSTDMTTEIFPQMGCQESRDTLNFWALNANSSRTSKVMD